MQNYNENNLNDLEDPKSLRKEDQWREDNDPDEIEFLLPLQNQRHFDQAETYGTLFTDENMKNKLNWKATTAAASAVYSVKYVNADLYEVEKFFINNFQRVTGTENTTNKLRYD